MTAYLLAGEAAAASGQLLAGAPAFRIRLALLAIATIAGLVFGLRGARSGGEPAPGKAATAAPVFLLLFCLLAVSAILGRGLFFSTIVRM